MNNRNTWYEIVISPGTTISGQDVRDVSRVIADHSAIGVVWFTDIIGDATALAEFKAGLSQADQFLGAVKNARVYDWGFFFFFQSRPDIDDYLPGKESAVIKRANVTIRVADSSYIYVYTQNKAIAEALRSAYPDAVVASKAFETLTVMY